MLYAERVCGLEIGESMSELTEGTTDAVVFAVIGGFLDAVAA